MQMIMAVIRPNKVEGVKQALSKLGILGLTVTEAKGYARQMGIADRYHGSKSDIGFVPKISVWVCVKESDKDTAVNAIIENARTGAVGDGKIFIFPVAEAIRVRTGERDEAAL